MDKTIQDLVWSILPKEFKEEVKYEYRRVATKATKDEHDLGFMHAHERMFGIHNLTSDAEGEVELLHVTRQKVMGLYANAKKIHDLYTSATCINTKESQQIDICNGVMSILDTLFGSKCLPDVPANEDNFVSKEPKYHVGQRMYIKHINKVGTIDIVQGYNKEEDSIYYHLKVEPKGVATAREEYLQLYEEPKAAEPKFKVGDTAIIHGYEHPLLKQDGAIVTILSYHNNGDFYSCAIAPDVGIDVDAKYLEPYTEPTSTFTDGYQSQRKSQSATDCHHFDNILNAGFRDRNRLHIAAMAMAGILSNADRMKQYGEIAMRESMPLTGLIAANALRYADALIKESHKTDNQ